MKKQVAYKLVLILFFIISGLVVVPVGAQVSIPPMVAQGYQLKHHYSQDFNTLPASGSSSWANGTSLPGWYAVQKNGEFKTSIIANNGDTRGFALYSFGSVAATDRALGGHGAEGWQGYYYALRFKNDSGRTIKHINVSFAIEQWYWTKTASSPFSFSYKTGASVTNPADATGWTTVTNLAGSIKAASATANAKPLSGNDAANRIQLQDLILQVNLAPGDELMLRWEQQDAVYESNNKGEYPSIALDDVQVEFVQNDVFYAIGKVLSNISNWTTDGTTAGRTPTNFTDVEQLFVVNTAGSYKLSKGLAISGVNSKLILGQGTDITTLTVPNKYALKGSVDIADNATLILNHASVAPTFGSLASNSTVVYTDSTSAPIGGTYGNLRITGGRQKTIDTNLLVKGKLWLDETSIMLRNSVLTLDNGATLEAVGDAALIKMNAGASIKQYVQGGGSNFLPIASETGYAPVKVALPAGNTPRYVSINVTDGIYVRYDANQQGVGEPVRTEVVNKVWNISQEGATTPDATVTFYWNVADELPNFDRNLAELAYYNAAKEAWEAAGASSTTGARVAATTPANYMGQTNVRSGMYAVWQPPRGPLPVELTTFTANYKNGFTTLNWSTASEYNSSYFVIETSTDGKHFSKVGEVKAAGFSTVNKDYTFTHQPTGNGIIYYRLAEYAVNGTKSYSKIVEINARQTGAVRIDMFPNPSKGKLYLASATITGIVNVVLCDITGKAILTQQVALEAGQPSEINLKHLMEGIYLVQVHSSAGRQVMRLLHSPN
ncbi:T9SS type A sorting domain-containing protein [Pontibacter sp. KCTC 32443]|uniref:T9SS type A sorting domain-containing protein n=1 Tax=Pontibacter TaxID=323449 RepID=UPI00164EAEF9|nr:MULTISPECIES: T9SS type A sorting domain-containing protein [Pontibacter]MBC5774360.1 T9SS type A sorting domain-containing protein [Pontibacter sp. KCTC 32443]